MRSVRPGGRLVCLGDLVEDVVVWQRSGPTVVGSDNPSSVTRTRGGSAANVAALAAPLVPTRFVGRVGDDDAGRRLTAGLTATGVDVQVQRAGRTGTVVVIVDPDGERTMFPDRAAGAELADPPPQWVEDAAALHISSYALARPASRAAVLDLARRAAALGTYLSVDTASVHLLAEIGVQDYRELIGAIAPDVVIANAPEAALLGRLPVPCWVVKDGARPVMITRPDGTVESVDVPPVAGVRDTTGAGDAFAAGFLHRILTGAGTREAVTAGIALAACVLATPGAVLAAPPLDDTS